MRCKVMLEGAGPLISHPRGMVESFLEFCEDGKLLPEGYKGSFWEQQKE